VKKNKTTCRSKRRSLEKKSNRQGKTPAGQNAVTPGGHSQEPKNSEREKDEHRKDVAETRVASVKKKRKTTGGGGAKRWPREEKRRLGQGI